MRNEFECRMYVGCCCATSGRKVRWRLENRRTRGISLIFPALSAYASRFTSAPCRSTFLLRSMYAPTTSPQRNVKRIEHQNDKTPDHKPPIPSPNTMRPFHSLTGHNMRANKSEENTVQSLSANIRPDDSGLPTISIQTLVHWILLSKS